MKLAFVGVAAFLIVFCVIQYWLLNGGSLRICIIQNIQPIIIYLNNTELSRDFSSNSITPSIPSEYPSEVITKIFWSFDNNYNDSYNVYNGISHHRASRSSSVGITNSGGALSVAARSSQYIEIPTPALSLVNRSFTIEAWINPGIGLAFNDFLIFAQCSDTTNNIPFKCLNTILRYGKPMNTWTHVAFVHDTDKKEQLIYINGILSGFSTNSSSYVGSSTTPLVIGGSPKLNMYFNGLIDELSLVTRVKDPVEILGDATLVFHYTFDSDKFLYDSGPNQINGTAMNVNISNDGQFNESISSNTNLSYFQTTTSALFDTPNQSYSFSFWIYAYIFTNSTILAWEDPSYALLLSLTELGTFILRHRTSSEPTYIAINFEYPISTRTWSYVAFTYSPTSGLRSYQYGVQMKKAGPCN